jgi:pilus assembly protein CpaF
MKSIPSEWIGTHPTQSNVPVGNALYPTLLFLLGEVRREINQRLSTDSPTEEELIKLITEIAERFGFDITATERDQILQVLKNDFHTFGILQPLVDDPEVSDIIVRDYATIEIQKSRKNFSTGLCFPSAAHYEAFIERLLHKTGATYSTKQPIADSMYGSLARIHVVHASLCDAGPYLTIRLNRFGSVNTADLERNGLAPRLVLQYLERAAEIGLTTLIVGEVGTGKTTLTRALANKMPSTESILVIEDTPEIRIEHPHVRYLQTRVENIEGEGRVTPSQCIKAGMRMAMNRIIFGEIRDAEAAEAFIDVCASGHPGISTIHARSAAECITRLELFLGRAQPGVAREVLDQQIASAVQVVVHTNICLMTGRRRIVEVREVGPVADGVLRYRTIFQYQPVNGEPVWQIRNRVSAYRDLLGTQLSLHDAPTYLCLDDEEELQ